MTQEKKLTLYYPNGVSKEIELNQYRYAFVTKCCETEHKKQLPLKRITLRDINAKELWFELSKKEFLDKGQKYFFQSNNQIPFCLNGNSCYQAYIEDGDIIQIGAYKLELSLKHRENKLFDEDEMALIRSNLNIYIEGETGTGKSTYAKEIHRLSDVYGKFVHINLSAFSPKLIESELFGHTKGAFTGATKDRAGAISQSHNGTLFIDEIDSLPIDIQTKLLLFLDSKKVRPVGSNLEFEVNTRLIFASGSSLKKLVHEKKFRKDFYYRITSGHCIKLAPLRKNPERVEEFCHHFASKKNVCIASSLIEFYKTLKWPGNLRQLHFHLEQKIILNKKNKLFLDKSDKKLEVLDTDVIDFDGGYFLSLKEVKDSYIQKVLSYANGDIFNASKILKISPRTIRNQMRLA